MRLIDADTFIKLLGNNMHTMHDITGVENFGMLANEIKQAVDKMVTVREDKMFTELKDTIDLMNSADYKDRFVAEYWQTKIRYEKLKDFCNKIEAANTAITEAPQHVAPLTMLRKQQDCMGHYLHILELRAIMENIDLMQPIKSK